MTLPTARIDIVRDIYFGTTVEDPYRWMGGGVYGETWHKAGQKLNKQNGIDDYIACAEYVIAYGYTRPEKLAGQGTSAGGIIIGGALVQRPDRWAAMIIRVGVTNTLRNEFTESGAMNIAEHGSVTDEEGFRALLGADAYLQVKDDVAYPAVLLTTGLNDPRVVLPGSQSRLRVHTSRSKSWCHISRRPRIARSRSGSRRIGAFR